MPITTNTATPNIAAPDQVWYDPRAGETAPSLQVGTQEGAANPQELTFSLAQSLSPLPADQDYKANGTLRRSNATLELYRDADLNEASKLDFCENQATLANAELKAGLKLYAKGLATGFVDLTLTLDMLETATRKKTDFSNGAAVATMINVNNNVAGAKKTIQLMPAEVVTPVIQQGGPDPQVTSSGTPVSLNFKIASTLNLSAYDGTGTVTVIPGDAKCKFYKDAKCDPGDAVDLTSGFAINKDDLKNGAVTLYARSTSDTATGSLAVQLALGAGTAPLKVAAAAPTRANLSLLPTSSVTPTITTTIDPSHDGTIWYPTLAQGALPVVAFGVTESNSNIAFKGEGVLTRSKANIALFYDKAMTKPLAFVDDSAALTTAVITGKLPFYVKGCASGDTTLTFTLVNDCQPSIMVQDPVGATLKVKAITEVVSNVDWQSPEIPLLPESEAGSGTVVRVFITQTSSGGGDYEGTATLTRSDAKLGVYRSDKRPLFSGSSLTVTLPNDTIRDTSNQYTVQWLGQTKPEDTVSLTLTPEAANEPYIVTDPSSQLAPVSEVGEPPLVVEQTNSVAPKIETDYDLVLLARGFTDTDRKYATTPTLAHFYCTQSDETIGYQGDGTLTRSATNIRVFRDKDCTNEILFVGNKATIPNADLLLKDKTYYVQGAAAGACSLKLSLEKPPSGLGTRPNFTVAEPAEKQLAVIDLTLDIYRDDAGSGSIVAVVPLSDRAKWQTGRFMPLQNGAKQFGLTKILVAKVATDTWPDSAAQHVVTLSVNSDKVELLDSSRTKKDLPLQLKKSDLSSGNVYELQSVGDQPSTAARDIHISLGMDRTDKDTAAFAGAPDSIKPAKNGDWSAATIVKIASVTPNIDNWRQYTNQPIDYSVTSNTNQDAAKTGQHALFTATTEPAIKGIGIDMMLTADAANKTDIPASTTSMPTANHLPAVTDAAGRASARMKLGRFGGQKYTGIAFLAEDAIAGQGNLVADPAATPAAYKSKPLTAWRKISYNLAYMKRHGVPQYDGNFLDLFNQQMLQDTFAESFLELDQANSNEVDNVPVLYQRSTNAPGGGGTTYSNWVNQLALGGQIGPYADRSFNLIFVENVSNGYNEWTQWFSKPTVNGNRFIVSLKNRIFDISANPRFLKPGSAKVAEYTLGFYQNWAEPIPDANVSIIDADDGQYQLVVDLSGVNLHGQKIKDLYIELTLYEISYFCGFSYTQTPVTVTADRYAEQLGAAASNEVYATTAHEVGHFLGLTPKKLPNAAGTGNILWYLGSDRNGTTRYYSRDTHSQPVAVQTYYRAYGQGPHCMFGYKDFEQLRTKHGQASKVKCLMFDSTVKPPITNVCDTCKSAAQGHEYALSNTGDDTAY